MGATLATSSLAFVGLADLGWFRPWLAGAVLALAAAVSLAVWRPLKAPAPRVGWTGILGGIVLLAAAALIAPGSENIVGPRDPGVYIATAFGIARGGSVVLEDPGLRLLGETIGGAEADRWLYRSSINQAQVRFPGQLFVRDLQAGQVEGGFLPVVPVWMAWAAGVGGLEPALHVSGAFGLLALLYSMLAGRAAGALHESGSPRIEWLLAGAMLAANFGYVWWSREPMAESALGGFGWLAAWASIHWVSGGGGRWAGLAALAATAAMFTRADGILVAAALGVVGVTLGGRQWWAVGGALLAGGLAFAIHAAVLAPTYTATTYGSFTLGRAGAGILAVAAIAAAALIFRLSRARGADAARLARPSATVLVRRAATVVAVAVVVASTLTGLAPGVGREPELGAASPLAWLSGYVPWPILILAAVGGLLLGWHGAPARMMPILLVGGLPALLFLPDPLVTGDHPWMVRRLVPAAIPFLCMLAALGASEALRWRGGPWLLRSMARTAASALLGIGLGLSADSLREVVSSSRHGAGIASAIAAVRAPLPDDAVVVFPASALGSQLAMPLQAVHGVRAFTVPAPLLTPQIATTLEQWQARGVPVYWASEDGQPARLVPGVEARLSTASAVGWASADGGPVPPPLRLSRHDRWLFVFRLGFAHGPAEARTAGTHRLRSQPPVRTDVRARRRRGIRVHFRR